jgi:hypothetical protein
LSDSIDKDGTGKDGTDMDGLDLPDFEAAWAEAVRTCGEMLRDFEGSLTPDQPFELAVTDEAGATLGRLRICVEFLDPPGGPASA